VTASLLLDLSDPFMIMALICIAVSVFGFGFIRGERHENKRWEANIDRLQRMRKEGLL
jgi:hypothetical protein